MKKVSLLLLLLATMVTGWQPLASAQGTRNVVVVEIFTGTWCTFCPGSALGADDLVHNGHDVAIIEHHIGDQWQTTESQAVDGWYGVQGYPTTVMDGTTLPLGGNANSSIYSSYLPYYNTHIGVATPFNMSMNVSRNNMDYTFAVNIDQVGANSSSNLVLKVVVTESHLPENWLAGLTEVNFTNRDMIPDQNGTPITITQGNQVNQNILWTMPGTYVRNNCEVIAYLQDSQTKEIFNGVIVTLAEPDFQLDAMVNGFVNDINDTWCDNTITPDIFLKNDGADPLTSVDIEYSVNGGTAQTFSWTGNLPFNSQEAVTLNPITFTPQPTGNTLDITLKNPNAGTDLDPSDDSQSAQWDRPSAAAGSYTLTIKPDNYGSEITWKFVDGTGSTVASGGPYQDNDQSIKTSNFTVPASGIGCGYFEILDSYGDGLTVPNGYYTLVDGAGNTVANNPNGNYASKETTHLNIEEGAAVVPTLANGGLTIFPNPSNGVFNVEFSDASVTSADLSVYQLNGQLVTSKTSGNAGSIDLSGQPAGIYLLKVKTDAGMTMHKITVQ